MDKSAFPHTRAQVYEQYERALFRLALYELQQEEIAALEDEDDAPMIDEVARRRAIKRIDRALSRRKTAQVLRRALPRAATAMACLVLVCAAGLTTVLATSQEARRQVMRLMVDRDVNFTGLTLTPEAVEPAQVPQGWAGLYYPTYIPASYAFDESMSRPDYRDVSYAHRRDPDKCLTFAEYDQYTSVGVDSFGAQVSRTYVHGREAVLSVKPSMSFVSWSEGDRFFLVTLDDDDQETLLRVANSVERLPQQTP